MPNILKSSAKTLAAREFLNSFYDAGGTDYIYMGLGDAGGEWANPASPDTPVDSYDAEQSFWENLIGIGQVSQANDTDLLVPRKTWESGATYVPYDESVETGSGSFDNVDGRDFYVCNTELEPKVYKLLTAGGGTSTEMPTHTTPEGTTPAPETEVDGYQWAYLYTIGSSTGDVSSSMLTNSWMPVPTTAISYSPGLNLAVGDLVMGDGTNGTEGYFYAGQIYQVIASSAATGANMGNDTNNTYKEWTGELELGAFYVGCSLVFEDFDATGINNVPYRQVALLRNPKNSSGQRILDQWQASNFEPFATLSRGVVLTLDNRVTVTRASGQTETIRLILEF